MRFRILKKSVVTMQDFEEGVVTIFKSSTTPTGKPLQFSKNGYTRTVKGILFQNWVFFYHKQFRLKDGESYVIQSRK